MLRCEAEKTLRYCGWRGAEAGDGVLDVRRASRSEHADKIDVVKINTDENPRTAASYGVTSIPTLNVYWNGELVKSIVGAKPKPALVKELSAFLG